MSSVDISPNAISILLLVSSIIVLILFVIVICNAGIKIQLVKQSHIYLILGASSLGGIAVIIIGFIMTRSSSITLFFGFPMNIGAYNGEMWIKLLMGGIGFSFIIASILKLVFLAQVKVQERYKTVILEKGKPLLIVKDLKVFYPVYGGLIRRVVAQVKAVNGVSFEIKSGETLGLVGESGCGKTTIAKHILGLVPRVEGSVVFNNEEVPMEYPNELRQQIQIVFQDPDASLNPRMRVVDIVAEPLRNLFGMTSPDALRDRVLQLLKQVSMKKEHLDRYPHEFSGGQKQRIIIARALACNPILIILDEPTSALDVSVQAQILNLLQDLQDEYGYSFMFITHNLTVVHHISDHVAVMYLGKLVEYGPVKEIFQNPVHPYTKALLSARSQIDPEHTIQRIILEGEVPSPINPPKGCAFHPRCQSPYKSEKCLCECVEGKDYCADHVVWCHEFKKAD